MGTELRKDFESENSEVTEDNSSIPGKEWDKDWREFYYVSPEIKLKDVEVKSSRKGQI